RFNIFSRGAVVTRGYRRAREEIKACLKQASGAKSFRRVGEDLRSALSTNSEYVAHYRRVVHALPILYCAEFYHTLRSQHSDQMAQLIVDIAPFISMVGIGRTVIRIVRQTRQMTPKPQREIGSSDSGLDHVFAIRSYCNLG